MDPLGQHMPKNNLVSGDIAHKTTSIWEDAISGRKKMTQEELKMAEAKKAEYVRFLAGQKTKEEVDEQKLRSVCKKCGQRGHMAFQCFNFLKKDKKQNNDDLNTLVSSGSDLEEVQEKSRSRSRSRHSHRHSHRHAKKSDDNASTSEHSRRHHHH